MALRRQAPLLAAGVVGAATGFYAFSEPLKQYWSGKDNKGNLNGSVIDQRRANSGADKGGSAAKDDGTASTSPHSAIGSRNGGGGGASPSASSSDSSPTVAGTSQAGRNSNSADHSPALRKDGGKAQDGTGGGGVGVAEMRERKEKGMGLPSPQGGDTKAQPVKAQKAYADHQGGPGES